MVDICAPNNARQRQSSYCVITYVSLYPTCRADCCMLVRTGVQEQAPTVYALISRRLSLVNHPACQEIRSPECKPSDCDCHQFSQCDMKPHRLFSECCHLVTPEQKDWNCGVKRKYKMEVLICNLYTVSTRLHCIRRQSSDIGRLCYLVFNSKPFFLDWITSVQCLASQRGVQMKVLRDKYLCIHNLLEPHFFRFWSALTRYKCGCKKNTKIPKYQNTTCL